MFYPTLMHQIYKTSHHTTPSQHHTHHHKPIMARLRNINGLLGPRSFSIPTHEQRYAFFSLDDKMNGVMDNWLKSVAHENWERHDFDNCTVFNFMYNINNKNIPNKSLPFVMRLDDTSISSFIDAIRVGILSRINECVVKKLTGMFSPKRKHDYTNNSISKAKHQSVQHIVQITSNNVGMCNCEMTYTPSLVITPNKDDRSITPNKDVRLLHESQQLESLGLCININKPIVLDNNLVGMWISISWAREFEKNSATSFLAFDVGKIVSYRNNVFNVLYDENGRKIYTITLHINDWYDCLESPPTRPNQWRLLSKKVSTFSNGY